jgi:ATP-binding cassette subfamily C protein CydC
MSSSTASLRLAHLLLRYKGRFALALLLAALALLAGLGLLAFGGHFITAAALAGTSAATAAMFDIFRPGATIRLFALVRTAGRYGERVVAHDAVLRLMEGLRSRVYAQLVALTPEPLARWSEGEVLQRLVGDVDALNEAPLRAGLPLLGSAIVVVVAIAIVACADARLVLPAAIGLLAAAVVVPLLTARHGLRDGRALAQRAGVRREALVDSLRGLTTLALCGAWPAWRDTWLRDDRALLAAQLRQRLRESAGQAMVVLLVGGTAWALLLQRQTMSTLEPAQVPWLAAAVLGVLATLEALGPAAGAWLAWGRARAAAQRLDDVLATPATIAFPAAAPLPPARGAVRVHDASYRYAGRDAGVNGVSFALPAGARLCVRGVSGAGKSTLAALLARSIDPDRGEIALDGCDLRSYDEASLRARVALLPQRPHLFAASVADNLRVADAQADDARLRAVLHAVALDAWLAQLPQGFDTPLGEYGVGLSGGEARRLALARTLLRPAVLFVLDEPFEGLDAALRERVADGIDYWAGERTVIVISHHDVVCGGAMQTLVLD